MNERKPVQAKGTNVDHQDAQVKSTEEISSETKPATELTPEEQMALYEKDLKENDWGHQPC
jgi:uncharacterized protein with gpF-like domain